MCKYKYYRESEYDSQNVDYEDTHTLTDNWQYQNSPITAELK